MGRAGARCSEGGEPLSLVPERLAAALADRYRLERELGQGGMATVYVAEDLKHHRRVAVKVLRPELAAAMGAERFLREIDTTANLRHPHILPLFDSGEADGFLFYVMPLVEGESLRDRLARERQLPIADALQIGREVADALNYAHAHGVVHRDIKPENILLEGGHAVVADFGIARAVTTAGGASLTETGIAVGTPSYMSPEQAAGNKDLDGRSDQYALGCLLYEMLAGQPPFTGPTAQSVVHQHFTSEARPITDIRPGVSREVAAALTRALAKTPADRFESLGRLAEALQARDAEPARGARPSRLALGVGIAVVGAILLGAVLLTRRDTPTLQLGRRTQVTLDPGLELDAALSPDGRFLAYSGSKGELMLRQVEGGTPLRVVREGGGAGRWPAWVPDGQRLLFVSPRGVEIVSALGGAPRLLMPAPGLERGLAVSPDGRTFAWVSHDSLLAAPVDGGPARLVTMSHEMHSLAWSPGGDWIAYVAGNIQYVRLSDIGNVAPSSIWLAPSAGGASRQVSDSVSLNVSPAWASARSLLYVSNREGGRDVFQVELSGGGSPRGTPRRLTTGLNAHGISVSPNGGRLAYSAFTESSNAWTLPIPATGAVSVSRATPVTVGNQTIENIDVSSDESSVAFCSDRDGRTQIYRARIGDTPSEPRQVSNDSAGAFWVAWSPDGKEIASHRFRGERRMIVVFDVESGMPTSVTDGRDDERSPEWSPDGRSLLVLANWATRPELRIYTRGANGTWSGPRALPIVIGADTLRTGLSKWSPDGRWLACGCGDGGPVIVPVDGGPARRLPSPFSSTGWAFPQWSADGRTVFHLVEEAGQVRAIAAVPVAGGTPRIAVNFDDPTRPWHRFGFRVRGNRFYFTLGDVQSDIWVTELAR